MHGSILPVTIPPPGQPRGQVQPFVPGGGELFEAVLSRGGGGGKSKIISSCSCKVRHFPVDAGPLFPGKISRISSRLVRGEQGLKIKICIRRYVYYKLLNECPFDAY